MKNTASLIFLAVAFCFLSDIKAQDNNFIDKQQLIAVNQEWKFQPEGVIDFPNEVLATDDYRLIKIHLMLVEKVLRDRDVSHLSPSQLQNRLSGLDALHAYWMNGVFPINTSIATRNPVFIDELDTYCAVGHLIKSSGNDPLARSISRDMNFSYLKDMESDQLDAWVVESGFTADELAWIQPGYPPMTAFDPMGEGTNGIVNDITLSSNGNVVIAGEFTQADGQPATNIVEWISGFSGFTWVPVGNGIDGKVNALVNYNDKLIAAGAFNKAGSKTVNNIAAWDGATWSAMGNIDGRVNDLIVYNNELYAAGMFNLLKSPEYRSIVKWNGSDWVPVSGTFPGIIGEVYTLEVAEGKLWIGGEFSMARGAVIRNIISFDGNTIDDLGGGVVGPVRTIAHFNNEIIAAGDFIHGLDTFGIASYNGAKWKSLMDGFGYLEGVENHLFLTSSIEGNELILGGNFEFSPFVGTYSKNLVSYNGEWFRGEGVLDSSIHVIKELNNRNYMGGMFKHATIGWSGPDVELNSVTSFKLNPVGIKENETATNMITVFPNPFNERVNVQLDNTSSNEQIESIDVFDITGKRVLNLNGLNKNKVEISADQLAKGSYVLKAYSALREVGTARLVVN